MVLEEYKRKRSFDRTPEPKGKRSRKQGSLFVIQKHQARNLHYDFRLELDGVLKSWAVPKGPCADATVKRLAMHVEDHPIEYGSFEGVIPQGEYGGGTVMVWDKGHWEPIGDPNEGYQKGRLKFNLFGEKLTGKWMLLRTGGRSQYDRDPREWLLFKEKDDAARSLMDGNVLVEQPTSVLTGRTLEEIAADRDKVWSSTKQAGRSSRRTTSKSLAIIQHIASTDDAKGRKADGVRLTHPKKMLFPEQRITKLDLANFYIAISEWILPHIANRPLVLVRCPDGCDRHCFYQKHPTIGTPEALRQIPVRQEDGTKNYVVVDDVAGLASLVQIAALEIHAWGARADKLERPDRLIFDLDPGSDVPWKETVTSAHAVRQFLHDLELESFVKTTGAKGLHLVVPIDRRHDWDDAKEFCKQVADLIVKAAPRRFTANMSKEARVGKIYIDYHRNGRGATAVAPFSTRAKSGAPVSTPLAWSELSENLRSDQFAVQNLIQRLTSLKQDPWKGIDAVRQGLSGPMKKLRSLMRGV